MASWEPAFAVQRRERDRIGKRRRQEAWLALLGACSLWATVWAWRTFFG